jgi:rubredoxin
MTVASDAKREEQNARRPPLVEGRYMRCPRCKTQHDVLRFVPMGVIEEYATETNPIYKCPSCRWVFSPALTVTELRQLFELSSLTQGEQT